MRKNLCKYAITRIFLEAQSRGDHQPELESEFNLCNVAMIFVVSQLQESNRS